MGLKDKFSQMKEAAASATEKIKEAAAPTLDTIKTKSGELAPVIKEKVNEASVFVSEKAEKAIEATGEVATKAKTAIADKAEEISPEGVAKARAASEKVKDATGRAGAAVSEAVGKAKDAVVEKAEEISPEGVEKVREASAKVQEKTAEMNILNSTVKKEALDALKEAAEAYETTYNDTIEHTVQLHDGKVRSADLLKRVESFVNTLSNSPKEIKSAIEEIQVNRQHFEETVDEIEKEISKKEKFNEGATGAGVIVGTGLAALGPSAAMAIATTFGTTSTGVAISSLSGAAATKAAMAWLGGGALSAGGSGMAGGKAVLSAFGPIGLVIGGAALLTGGLIANGHNQTTAQKAEEQTVEIKEETTELLKLKEKVTLEAQALDLLCDGINGTLEQILALGYTDYKMFSTEQKQQLMVMLNSAQALSKRIGESLV